MKLLLTIEVEIDDELYGTSDKESMDWLINDILLSGKDHLILHSNEIGDEIGTVKVLTAEVERGEVKAIR